MRNHAVRFERDSERAHFLGQPVAENRMAGLAGDGPERQPPRSTEASA